LLKYTKHIVGTGKQCLISYNCGCAYANRFVVLAKGLDVLRLKAVAAGGWGLPSGNSSFAKKKTLVGWMDVWGFNQESFGSL
jgi:hypothetical protein